MNVGVGYEKLIDWSRDTIQPNPWIFRIFAIRNRENLNFQTETTTMKRMFSKKGLVESSKEEHIEDVESDADLQE